MKKRGMSRGNLIFLAVIVGFFLFGWYSNNYYYKLSADLSSSPYGLWNTEKYSPKGRIKDNQLLVYDSMVVLNVSKVEWSKYTDTNSMDPVLDETSNGLTIRPETEEDISVGDIISYSPSWTEGILPHRVVDIGEDEEGRYYIVKGDNSRTADPEKVRFNQIEGILIGVIY
ncbi:MAG: hypothetical protein KKA79_06070 [Nanoarchaeota archaeon]|nr:hypothetical protein [Nanoarchaeota archaeon]